MNYDPFVKEDFILPKKWCIKSQSRDQDYLINEFARSSGGMHWSDEYNHAKSNYLNISNGKYQRGSQTLDEDFTEITFEQFQKYAIKTTEQPKVIETKVESKSIEKWSVGSYVVFLKDLMHINAGYIDVIKETLQNDCVYLEKYLTMDIGRERSGEVKWFATKSEAEEFTKTLVKPVKETSALTTFPIEGYCKTDNVELRRYLTKRPNTTLSGEPKWIEGKSVGVGWNERSHWVVSEKSSKPEYQLNQLEKFFTKGEIKQPLKQAVHCTTQEEWDFVTSKFNPLGLKSNNFNKYKSNSIIIFTEEQGKGYYGAYSNKNETSFKEILSFQEWCDLNGYKMEKEVKFEVGKWYEIINSSYYKHEHISKFKEFKNNRFYYSEKIVTKQHKFTNDYHVHSNEVRLCTIEEIQQYLPDSHPDKIKVDREFKFGDWVIITSWYFDKSIELNQIAQIKDINLSSSAPYKLELSIPRENYSVNTWYFKLGEFRHATSEEINNHLISIGQIPAGEPLNTGIEPNKDGMFKYKQTMPGASWSGGTIDNHLDVMIPTTGNSYNKDFSTSIIPVKSISAEVEFNFLPEPK